MLSTSEELRHTTWDLILFHSLLPWYCKCQGVFAFESRFPMLLDITKQSDTRNISCLLTYSVISQSQEKDSLLPTHLVLEYLEVLTGGLEHRQPIQIPLTADMFQCLRMQYLIRRRVSIKCQ